MIVWKRLTLIGPLIALLVLLASFIYAVATGCWPAGKLLGTMSAVSALAAIAQLSVSGFWERVMQPFTDVEQFPFGPPSSVVREVIYNPDTPIRSELRSRLFFDSATGAALGIFSIIVGGIAVWF